ncbi:hypothetical protein SFC07_09735 [Corynebacterium callunae]|uniref:hypothetical protein n=1 Tax=Corynebacterium callunae TaxID=1721 RepID=UPI0039826D9C
MITILIDGQSGSGKTTLAAELAEITGFQLVHLDDFYPGWSGLAAASEMVARDVLHPKNPGFFRWDWELNRQGEWVSLKRGHSLIVEGAGALSAASKSSALKLGTLVTVRITAPESLRKKRALQRDPSYAPYWEMWAEQEREHLDFSIPADIEIVLDSNGVAI